MSGSGTYDDPYAIKATNRRYLRKDTTILRIKASDLVNAAQLSQGIGQPIRVAWRPPLAYRKTSSGIDFSDPRGQHRDLVGYKISFKNQTNMPITVRGSTPLARLSTTQQHSTEIVTRANVTVHELKPNGERKEVTRGKGRKSKSYSVPTDKFVVDVLTKRDFKYDNNFYVQHQQSVPASSDTTNYNALVFTLFDFFAVEPSVNQYTGVKLADDMDVLLVQVDVRYVISRLEKLSGTSVEEVNNFILGRLANLDATYHVDTIFNGTTGVSARNLSQPVMAQFPRTNYPAIAIVPQGNLRKLSYVNGHNEIVGDVIINQYQDPDYRISVLGLEHIRIPHVGSGWRGQPGSCEFAYSRSHGAWYICDIDGNPRGYEDTAFNIDDYKITSAGVFVVYDTIRPVSLSKLGEIGYKGNEMGLALSWDQWIDGATIIIKALLALAAI